MNQTTTHPTITRARPNEITTRLLRPRTSVALLLLALPLGCGGAYEGEDETGDPASLGQTFTSGTGVNSTENTSAPFGAAVRLSFNGNFRCSGVKIGANRFLTAGHCLAERGTSVQISNTLDTAAGSTFTIPAGKVFVHPTFQLTHPTTTVIPNTVYDVAVFEVTQSSTSIPSLAVTAQPVFANTALTGVGYGLIGTTCATTGTTKLKAGVTAADEFGSDRIIHNIVDFGDPSSCDGDSGGPLVRGSGTSARVVGLVSSSFHSSNPNNSETHYARLSNVAEWISEPLDSTLGDVAGLIADNKAVYLMNGSLEGSGAAQHPGLRCAAQNGTGSVDGADVRLHACDGVDGFFSGSGPGWRLLTSATGGFKVVNRLNGRCMAINPATPSNQTNVFVTSCAASGNALKSQSWTFEPVTPVGSSPIGTAYRLHNTLSSGLCLATQTGVGNENDDVRVVNCNSTSNQQWFATR